MEDSGITIEDIENAINCLLAAALDPLESERYRQAYFESADKFKEYRHALVSPDMTKKTAN